MLHYFLSCPSTFLALQVFVVLMSAVAMVSTVWSLSCFLFSYTRCPGICKCVGTCSVESALLRVGQFHTQKKHYKAAIQSECTVSRVEFVIPGLFSQSLDPGLINFQSRHPGIGNK